MSVKHYDLHVFQYAWGSFSNPKPVHPMLVLGLIRERMMQEAIAKIMAG
jgi:hypothetical protein